MAAKKKVAPKKEKQVEEIKAPSTVAEARSNKAQLDAQTVGIEKVTEEQAKHLSQICEAVANKLEQIVKQEALKMGIEVSLSVYLNIKNFSQKS